MRHHSNPIVTFGDNGIHLKPEKTYDVRIAIAAACACIILLCGVFVKKAYEEYVLHTTPAVYGWMYDTQTVISLRPAEMHSLWSINSGVRFKVELSAAKPVEIGLVPVHVWLTASQTGSDWSNEIRKGAISGCGGNSILMQSLECISVSGEQGNLYVLDSRNFTDASTAAMSRLLGNDHAGAELLDSNQVTVRLYHWTCTAHCEEAVR
jgi:hypothetical protein